MKKTFAVIIVGALFLLVLWGLAPAVRAEGPVQVYIGSDGSVAPSFAPVSSRDNVTYTFTGNISYPAYDGVVVERNNVVIDGNGYTIQGNNNIMTYDQTTGLNLTDTNNVTIENANIQGFHYGIYLSNSNNNVINWNNATANGEGIYLFSSSNNTFSDNNATANGDGIGLYSSSNNNIVSGNNVTANWDGIRLDESSNNTVSGNNVTANGGDSILLYSSSSNIVSGNNAKANVWDGIYLFSSSNNNIVCGNNATANEYGIYLEGASNNTIYHNNFIGNVAQTSVDSASVGNVWDDGYPSGGNYWSDYNGTDLHSGLFQNGTGSDGIGDTPYVIDSNSIDNYPLMGGFSTFNVAEGIDVQVVSNSTVSDFQFNGTAILFNVSGVNGTTGFCNVRVPTALLNGTFAVFVNGTKVQYSLLPSLNSTQTYLYFTYGHSTEQIIIVPEFPVFLILAMFMLATLLAIAIYRKRHSARWGDSNISNNRFLFTHGLTTFIRFHHLWFLDAHIFNRFMNSPITVITKKVKMVPASIASGHNSTLIAFSINHG